MLNSILHACVMVLLFSFTQGADSSNFLADRIMMDLMGKYQKAIRPMCGGNFAVNVTLDVALRQIVELNVRRQILQGNLWLRMTWEDCRLRWNASEVEGVTTVTLSENLVWTPDLTLYDNAEKTGMPTHSYRVRVRSTGQMEYNVPVVIFSLCQIDVTRFPFDEQHCNLSYGSWAYSGLELNLTNKDSTGDITSYVMHVEWTLVSMRATLSVPMFDGVPYPIIKYTLHLRRKSLFYVINLLFPCMLITFIAVLGFLLPPDSGEKVNLAITVLLSLAVFEMIVLEMMPPTSETLPVIGLYFASSMVLVALSCLMTVVVLNMHYRGNRGLTVPPLVMNVLVRGLGRVLCVPLPDPRSPEEMASSPASPTPHVEQVVGTSYIRRRSDVYSFDCGLDKHVVDLANTKNDDENGRVSELSPLLGIFRNIQLTLASLCTHIAEHDFDRRLGDDWHLLAIVLDRAFLLIYFVCSVVVILSFILTSVLG